MFADRYLYPAILHFADDGISVEFPDFPGCFSYGNDELQAVTNAREALELHISGLKDDSDPIPPPSHIRDITVNENETVVLIDTTHN